MESAADISLGDIFGRRSRPGREESTSSLREVFRETWSRLAHCALDELRNSGRLEKTITPAEEVALAERAIDAFEARVTCGTVSTGFSIRAAIKDEVERVLGGGGYKLQEAAPEGNPVRKGPSNKEQLQRNSQLMAAVEACKSSPELQKHILKLAQSMLSSCYPAEMFNDGDRSENDLTDNFVLWTLINDHRFNDHHRAAAYLFLFEGHTAETAYQEILAFEKRDTKKIKKRAEARERGQARMEKREINPAAWTGKTISYGIAQETLASRYDEVMEAFSQDGQAMLERFLEKAQLNLGYKQKDRELIPNYSDIVCHCAEWMAAQIPKDVSAEAVYDEEKRKLQIPKTELEKCLDGLVLMMLQRGNITARNWMMVRLLRMISAFAHGKLARCRIGKYGGAPDEYQDLEQTLVETAIEKLAMADPRRGRISTYIIGWSRGGLMRFCFELDLVRLPIHVQERLEQLRHEDTWADDPIRRGRVTHRTSTKELLLRGSLSAYPSTGTSLEKPLDLEDKDFSTLRDVLPEMASATGDGSVEADLDRQRQEMAALAIVEKALGFLAPRDGYILAERLRGRTLEDIGRRLGVTKENTRQLQDGILARLETTKLPYGKSIIVADEARLMEWAERVIKDKTLRRRFYAELQVDVMSSPEGETGDIGSLAPGMKKSIGVYKKHLIKEMEGCPEEERFAFAMENSEICRRFRKAFAELEALTGRPSREIAASIRATLERSSNRDEKEGDDECHKDAQEE